MTAEIKTVESKLEVVATAKLKQEVEEELKQEDKPKVSIAELLKGC